VEEVIQMKPFSFQGKISASKSMMNRALIVQSLFPGLKIIGDSACDDVIKMKQAVQQFPKSSEIDCGDAGTVLRFMALRASREKGMFRMKGSQRLFERPQDDLLFVLHQLQVNAQLLPNELVMQSEGWKKPLVPLRIHREKSSQFATGLLLSCWDLPFPIEFELTPVGLKDSYWNMSIAFAESLGMVIEKKAKDCFRIPQDKFLLSIKSKSNQIIALSFQLRL
jgi:3-phosphoshikimate 1-carboxyvinyltransferase